MSFSSQTYRAQYNGNDVTTAFAFGYLFHDEDHLVVTLTNTSGTDTVQTKTTHYTVTGEGVASGGTVTMVTAPATGEKLTIERIVPYTQESEYVADDSLDAENLEKDLDLAKMAALQLGATGGAVDRSIKYPSSETTFTATLPNAAGRASKVIAFDEDGLLELSAIPTTAGDSLILNGTASGTDTYVVTFTPAPTVYSSTDIYLVTFTNANTGASTINVNALGAKAIVKRGGSALEAGDIAAGQRALLIYNGTNFELAGLYEHRATHVTGGSDEIDGDKLDIDWTPANYTPTTSPSEADHADNLTAHLAGIDAEIGTNASDIATNASDIGYRKIGQVVYTEDATYHDDFSTGTPLDDTIPDLTASAEAEEYTELATTITPLSASSTILIQVCINCVASVAQEVVFALSKDSDTAPFYTTSDRIGVNPTEIIAFQVRHSPATTSATTYKLWIGNTGFVYVNGSSSSRRFGGTMKSSLTLTEILP